MPLEPIDQARLLAVGFYHLVERLARAGVPLVFLAFPRFAEDADYLFAELAKLLPGIDAATARAVHARLADPALVRVGAELVAAGRDPAPDLATLDGIALRRELTRLRGELAAARAAAQAADELGRRNQALGAEIGRLTQAQHALLASKSWRLTAPIRATSARLRRLFRPS
jgi:hypothetical protein